MSPIRRRPAAITDPRDQPAYPLGEAVRYLKLAPATLRSWVLRRSYPTAKGDRQFFPLIRPAGGPPPVLSFWNLIEAHVLRALRSEHGVSVKHVRKALEYAEGAFGICRLLLRRELCSHAGELFLERYGQLINLSASGQLALRRVLAEHLKRIAWDEWQFPIRLYPFLLPDAMTADKPIAIDPSIGFGRPVVMSRGVSTATIAQRVDVGESVAALAADYDLTPEEIEEAIVYERAA